MSDDLRKLYRDLIEPELNEVHQWLDVPERAEPYGNISDMSLLAAQSEILHLIDMDRRVTLLEAQCLKDR